MNKNKYEVIAIKNNNISINIFFILNNDCIFVQI